jgi:hypothetical protein
VLTSATKYISQEYTELQADLCQQLGSFLNGINDLMKTAGHSPQNEAARIKLYHSLQDHLDISKQSSVEMIMRDMKEFIHHAAPVGDEVGARHCYDFTLATHAYAFLPA